jgi:hypothetical protein
MKRTKQRNSNKWSKAKIKAKNKITWMRKVSVPLGKGNSSRQPRQKQAQAKSTNNQSKPRKPKRAPTTHMQAPPEPMQLPLDECMQTFSQNRIVVPAQFWIQYTSPVRPVHHIAQVLTPTLVRTVPSTSQADDHLGTTRAHKWLETTRKPSKYIQ